MENNLKLKIGSDSGEATILVSGIGAVLTSSPVIVGLISQSDAAGNLSFIIALLVSVFALGAGVGKLYNVIKKSIIESAKRDDLLSELVTRLDSIENRQIQIQEEVNRQAAQIQAKLNSQ
jgi:hypothetical protein